MEESALTFAYPWLAYSAGAVFLILFLFDWLGDRIAFRRLEKFASSRLLSFLTVSADPLRRQIKSFLVAAGVASLLLALAGPRWGYELGELTATGRDVLIALDVSRSMLATDYKPNRLENGKLAIRSLVRQLEGDRVGLIAFSGNAFLQCPLTLDYEAFALTLEEMEPGILPRGGSDIAAAIEEAQATFANREGKAVLILVTDGEDLGESGIATARAAAESGLSIYTVGVGSSEGELIPVRDARDEESFLRDRQGNLVQTKLDEPTLREIARVSNGLYTPLGTTGDGLLRIYEQALEGSEEREGESARQRLPIDRYQWPLAAGILFLLAEMFLGTRKSNRGIRRATTGGLPKAATFLIAAVLSGLAVEEMSASPREGVRAYEEGNYSAAKESFQAALEDNPDDPRLHYNLGLTQYEESDFVGALESFQKALNTEDADLQADTYFNLANSLFKQGRAHIDGGNPQDAVEIWEEAIQRYQTAAELSPEAEDVQANLAIAERQKQLLEEWLKQQPPQQSSGDGDQQEEGEESEDNQQPSGGGGEGSQNEEGEEQSQQDSQQQSGESEGNQGDSSQQEQQSGEQNEPSQDDLSNEPSEEQSQDSPSNQDSSQNESEPESEDQDSSGSSGQDPSPEENEPESESGGQSGEDSESQETEPSPQEDSGEGGNGEEQSEPESGDEAEQQSGSSEDEKESQADPSEGNESASAAEATAGEPVEGQMTEMEAAALLDSLRDSERKLPASRLLNTRKSEGNQNDDRDW